MQNRSVDGQSELPEIIKAAFKGVAFSIGAVILFAAIFTLTAYVMEDPMKFIGVFSLFTLFVGAFVGGMFSGKVGGVYAATLFVALYLVLLWVISLFFKGDGVTPMFRIVVYLICLIISLMSAVLTSKRKSKRISPSARRKRALHR